MSRTVVWMFGAAVVVAWILSATHANWLEFALVGAAWLSLALRDRFVPRFLAPHAQRDRRALILFAVFIGALFAFTALFSLLEPRM